MGHNFYRSSIQLPTSVHPPRSSAVARRMRELRGLLELLRVHDQPLMCTSLTVYRKCIEVVQLSRHHPLPLYKQILPILLLWLHNYRATLYIL